MNTKQQLDADLKSAMLAGDKSLVTTLRGLKSAILYAEVAANCRESGLPEVQVMSLFSKEAKKRQESADLYRQGGDEKRAAAEMSEKAIIERYLPQQLNDNELKRLINTVVDQIGPLNRQNMGQIIAEVKRLSDGRADGSRIAQIIRGML